MKFEIWLGNNDTHFARGVVHYEDGTTQQLDAYSNISIQQDSLLVGVIGEEGFAENHQVRWYPKPGLIEIYGWDEEVGSLLFHNASEHDIYIFKYVYLAPGQSAEIRSGDIRTDALFARFDPVGLAVLSSTTHADDPGFDVFVGKPGVLLRRPNQDNPSKQVLRFVLIHSLDPTHESGYEADGFDTSAGEFSYDDLTRLVFRSNSEYVFTML